MEPRDRELNENKTRTGGERVPCQAPFGTSLISTSGTPVELGWTVVMGYLQPIEMAG